MKVSAKSRLYLRLQNLLFLVLFLGVIGLLAWFSARHTFVSDWTADGRHTLSQASLTLLSTLDKPVAINAFVRDNARSRTLKKRIEELVARYRRHKPDISLRFINPDIEPQTTRELGISNEGELLIRYGERSEKPRALTEQSLTNALQRVARSAERWLVFISGHGERRPQGQANHDMGDWGAQLRSKGFLVQNLNLGETRAIPDNTSVLIIASPRVAWLPGELKLVNDYLDRGGNLLWLTDPRANNGEENANHLGLGPLAERLGLEFLPGTVVDAATQVLNIPDPRYALIAEYPAHPTVHEFDQLTLFPQAVGIEFERPEGWRAEAVLVTNPSAWSETGAMQGGIKLDPGDDIAGPLNIGVALTRQGIYEAHAEALGGAANLTAEQRILVIGDGDFLSNAFIGNAGNLNLGLNFINWLSRDDNLIDIPAKTATDLSLELSPTASAMIGLGFLFGLPLMLLASGVFIWWRRRKQ